MIVMHTWLFCLCHTLVSYRNCAYHILFPPCGRSNCCLSSGNRGC